VVTAEEISTLFFCGQCNHQQAAGIKGIVQQAREPTAANVLTGSHISMFSQVTILTRNPSRQIDVLLQAI
jgi:hypothetical protein